MTTTDEPKRVAVMLDLGEAYQRHTTVLSGIMEHARQQHWSVIIDEFADDTLARRGRRDAPYDGVIARATSKLADQAARLRLPVVNLWHNSPALKRLPGVFVDAQTCGRLRAEHLMSRGLRHFGALTGNSIGHRLNLKGFIAELRAGRFECLTAHVAHTPSASLRTWRQSERVIDEWISRFQLPIGLYVAEDEVGRLVTQACLNRGWRIPEDVAIVSGNNELSFCDGPSPALTSVELGMHRVGCEAAMMLDRMMHGEPAPTKHLLLPPIGLVVRESTDFHAVDDEMVGAALRYIGTQSHRPIGPDDVAHAVGVSPRTLQYRFKQCLGRAVATEIRRVRLERAKRELIQSDRPLADIARDVGFGTRMRMYQVFCRELEQTPSDYRKAYRRRTE